MSPTVVRAIGLVGALAYATGIVWLYATRPRTLAEIVSDEATFRAWYEAQHGAGSWEAMGLIPKETWAAYLSWYRRTLAIPVRSDTRAGALRWDARASVWEIPTTDARDGAHAGADRRERARSHGSGRSHGTLPQRDPGRRTRVAAADRSHGDHHAAR